MKTSKTFSLGQRCSGRNYQGRRCCTPENPCDEGEGDCDGPADGGQHDGHAGCKGDLVCGSNNCKQFGAYFHPKDDCCEKASKSKLGKESPSIIDLLKDKNTPTFFKPIGNNYKMQNIKSRSTLSILLETPFITFSRLSI